jgi:hypothetical protein
MANMKQDIYLLILEQHNRDGTIYDCAVNDTFYGVSTAALSLRCKVTRKFSIPSAETV